MIEIWKDVPLDDFKEYYSVSSLGRIYSKRTKKILLPKKSKAGYLRVAFSANGLYKNVSVHRMVAMAFIPNESNKPTVNHKNECKTDNRVENLEWATNAEQNAHGTRTQRAIAHTDWKARSKNMDYASIASKHDYSSQHMCNRKRTIVSKNGLVIGIFDTQKDAANAVGVSKSQVCQCVSGKKHSCKGYVFEEVG